MNAENARIALLGMILIGYMLVGASIFTCLELPNERRIIQNYADLLNKFQENLSNETAPSLENFKQLLQAYEVVTNSLGGVPRPNTNRWNFSGSFYFVCTIISTIGYGSYTPSTKLGKIFVIFYGFLGCSGGILFFNLMLERLITFIAYFLRKWHMHKVKMEDGEAANQASQCSVMRTQSQTKPSTSEWKPSVYLVMAFLIAATVLIGTIGVSLYSIMEGWGYVESAYFCFISFATIGFGDIVPLQQDHEGSDTAKVTRYIYTIFHTFLLTTGCCCVYSLFNVMSIVLKQVLNCIMIKYLQEDGNYCHIMHFMSNICGGRDPDPDRTLRKYSMKIRKEQERKRRRRSSIPAMSIRSAKKKNRNIRMERDTQVGDTFSVSDDDPTYGGGGEGLPSDSRRKVSDSGLISLKDFRSSNQVCLAMLQKQLHDSANPELNSSPNKITQQRVNQTSAGRFIPATIGPLAILCDKFGDK